MTGKRRDTINPFWAEMLERAECVSAYSFAQKAGVGRSTIDRMAYEDLFPEQWITLMQIADTADMTVDEVLQGLLGAQNSKKIAS